MTLAELKERIDWLALHSSARLEDIEVCIPNHKGGQGGTSVTRVKSANKGTDWDKGKFMIFPEVDMIEKPQTQTPTQHKRFKDEWGNSDWRDTGEMGG